MMKQQLAVGVVVVAGALLACRAKLDGSITVDGKSFDVNACRSGEANVPKFDGVDFMDSTGRRARFVLLETGAVRAFLFDPGSTSGTLLGEGCGSLVVTRQNSEVNSVHNVEGTVTADCTGSGHTVKATMKFKNCH